MGEVAGALYGVETFIEGAVALAKGIYDPTLPLKATLAPISDLSLPRAYHTLSVVKGRAYIFGGKITGEDGEEVYRFQTPQYIFQEADGSPRPSPTMRCTLSSSHRRESSPQTTRR